MEQKWNLHFVHQVLECARGFCENCHQFVYLLEVVLAVPEQVYCVLQLFFRKDVYSLSVVPSFNPITHTFKKLRCRPINNFEFLRPLFILFFVHFRRHDFRLFILKIPHQLICQIEVFDRFFLLLQHFFLYLHLFLVFSLICKFIITNFQL